jgi:hypothetical protein
VRERDPQRETYTERDKREREIEKEILRENKAT